MKRASAVWVALMLLALSAAGDTITLKDGRSFEGTVTEREGRLFIEMPYGTISVHPS